MELTLHWCSAMALPRPTRPGLFQRKVVDGCAVPPPVRPIRSQTARCDARSMPCRHAASFPRGPHAGGAALTGPVGRVPAGRPSVACAAAATVVEQETLSKTWYDEGGVNVSALKGPDGYEVLVEAAHPRSMVLHWAVNDWQAPEPSCLPPGSHQVDAKAAQTPFQDGRRVVLRFPEDKAPERVVFVLKELEPENWINNGSCYGVQLKPPGLGQLVERVVDLEANADHWSLKDRFVLANDVLEGAVAAGSSGGAFMFTWLRLSAARLLTWARRSNYQSKDITWMQQVISERMSEVARGAKDPWVRLYGRLALAGLPRGSSSGDDIRMGILHIMRDHGIKEGHRPGIDEPFLEQWHQKLHQNTTPEDITICEAYLAYLHSGNHDDYWRVLWDNGRITKEHLEGMNIPIKSWPQHLPHMINAMKGYLWTLKTCHSGADMDTAAEMSKGYLDEHTRWMLFDMLKNRTEWWVPGKIVEIRAAMRDTWRAPGASRDLLLLDVALDNYFKTSIERIDRQALTGDSCVDLIALVLRNACLTSDNTDLERCSALWGRVASAGDKWSEDWLLQALAATQRTELSLAEYGDQMYSQVQPHANLFGSKLGIDAAHILNFAEEVIRGQSVFVLSWLLQRLEKDLRRAAGAGPWQVTSQVPAMGEVLPVSLAEVQGQSYDHPVVLLSQTVGGMEDIPPGVTAVLTESSTDVLSHVAIRARSQGVLLASCDDEGEWARLMAMKGLHVSLDITSTGDVSVTQVDPPDMSPGASPNGHSGHTRFQKSKKLQLPGTQPSQAWALAEQGFGAGVVGAKANNLAALRQKLPDWVKVPASVAIPFGSFERALAHPANGAVQSELGRLQGELAGAKVGAGVPPALEAARKLISTRLVAPEELVQEVSAAAAAAGLPGASSWSSSSGSWGPVWSAICAVWASKWNARAWLSRQATGVQEGDLFMSVLLQEVVAADYAFVLHTANPLTGASGEVFGEVVPGLGEVLVGNYPGRALSFMQTAASGGPKLLSLPSKRVALYSPPGGTLIARSDTNGEDLEAFAGAGLYDSVPVVPLEEVVVNAAAEALYWDPSLRGQLTGAMVEAGKAIETAFGGIPQDIEGVWKAGQMVVVQARPQVVPEGAKA